MNPATAPAETEVRWSAAAVAEAIGLPHRPTAEQTAVIEAPLRPLLVIAGAGSGKTETMAARVVWLVANGFVEPEDVLGLTFTRKAATELSDRIGNRLAQLRRVGLWTPQEVDGAPSLGAAVSVSTYHSYAGRLVREHGLRLGYEADTRLLSEAAAWQTAHEAVVRYDGPMDEVDKAESTVTAAVVDLAGEMAEHLQTPESVAAHLDRVIEHLEQLERGDTKKRVNPVAGELTNLRLRRAVLPIVGRYAELKRSRDAMDFADQMALAAQLAMTFDDIGAIERARHRVVLLDEFQDTSEAQLALLKALYVAPGETSAVTAVGDPHQSIYGWRGASATTLTRFAVEFGDPEPAQKLDLSTSWRNDSAVLDVANHLAQPLRAASRVTVEPLASRPGAGVGSVEVARLTTAADEADHIARWLAAHRSRGSVSAAVLCRKRAEFATVTAALEEHGIPHEVVGLGGLLLTPEVEDVVALLHVVQDPARGDHLVRLLSGPMMRLGIADLDALAAWSRVQQRLRGGAVARHEKDLAPDAADAPSIIEALDSLPPRGWVGDEGERLSDVARDRLAGLAATVRRMRGLTFLPLADLVLEAEKALGLDIEVLSRPEYTPAAARAHLDAFGDVAAQFSQSADRATLGGFLDWIKAAIDEERGLDRGYADATPDAVQVMTIHAAKGLEWDVVAVPALVESTFPAHNLHSPSFKDGQWRISAPKDKGWLAGLQDGGLPYELRGDRDGLPEFGWRSAVGWDELAARLEEFAVSGGEHAVAEERRLAYVAATRARHALLLTASVWSRPKTPTSDLTLPRRGHGARLDRRLAGPHSRVGRPARCPPRTVRHSSSRARRTVTSSSGRSTTWATVGCEPTRRRVRSRTPPKGPSRRLRPSGHGRASWTCCSPSAAGGRPATTTSSSCLRTCPRPRSSRSPQTPSALPPSSVVPCRRHPPRRHAGARPSTPGSRSTTRGPRSSTSSICPAAPTRTPWAMPSCRPCASASSRVPGPRGSRSRSRRRSRPWSTVLPSVVASTPSSPTSRAPTGSSSTGRPAANHPEKSRRMRALQLAAYRIAWARLRGVDPQRVSGAFYYAGTGETVWPDLADEAEISDLLAGVPRA